MALISEIATAYATLTGQAVFVGSRPSESTATAWTVAIPYSGSADDYIPTQEVFVQFVSCSTGQATALANAEAGRTALHQRGQWALSTHYVARVNAGPLTTLPPVEAQGTRTYRVVFSARMAIRPKS